MLFNIIVLSFLFSASTLIFIWLSGKIYDKVVFFLRKYVDAEIINIFFLFIGLFVVFLLWGLSIIY